MIRIRVSGRQYFDADPDPSKIIKRIRIKREIMIKISVSDQHYFDADRDPDPDTSKNHHADPDQRGIN